jgi:hypothetical protein
MGTIAPEAFRERVWVSITERAAGSAASTDIVFDAYLDTLEGITFGNRAIESKPLLNTGRVAVWTPEEDTEITLAGYFAGVGATAIPNVNELFFGGLTTPTFNLITPLAKRKLFRVAILVCDDYAVANATQEIPITANAERYVFANCYITVNNIEFGDDRIMKASFTLKVPPRSKAGTANMIIQDNCGLSVVIPVLGNYNETQNWSP